jgi:hypothetical protein
LNDAQIARYVEVSSGGAMREVTPTRTLLGAEMLRQPHACEAGNEAIADGLEAAMNGFAAAIGARGLNA